MATGFSKPPSSPASTDSSSSLLSTTDCDQAYQQLSECFEELTDPRGGQGDQHPFVSIVVIGLLASLGGAQGWEDIETYGP